MNRVIIQGIFILSLFSLSSVAQLPQNCNISDQMLIMGDSWAQYMYDDGVYNGNLDAYGHADKTMRSDVYEVTLFSSPPDPQGSYYGISGSEARQWTDESTYSWLQNVRDELNANPQITLVVISIGGNDVLAGRSDCGWYKNMDSDPSLASKGCGFSSETGFYNKLESDITYIINEILDVRIDINVLISSYDYPNFNVTTSWIGCLGCDLCDFYACPKRLDLSYDLDGNGSIDNGELITDAEINQMMISTELRRQAIADANPRVFFDNSMGLTQYVYGYAGNGGGTTNPPSGAPNYTPGGDANYPTDRDYFRLVDIPLWFDAPADPIHLDGGPYGYKVKNQLDNYIFEHVRGLQDEANHITLWSEGNNDGYVDILEDNVYNNGLRMGDEDTGFFGLDNDYRSILSFETSSIPNDATITGASIYIIRSSEEDNPFLHTDRNPVVDIKNGFWGTSPSLEVSDGTDSADGTSIGCFIGDATSNNNAIRIDIDASALQYVNTQGKTQFRLYFDFADWSDEYINFYDGAGHAGLTSPSEIIRSTKKHYEYYTIQKTLTPSGEYDEIKTHKSNLLLPKEGFVFEDILLSRYTDEHGIIIENHRSVLAVEHTGLAKYMSDNFSAPAGGKAPFIDITYALPLPLELTEFEVEKQDRNALLYWTINNDINFSHFEIEYSTDTDNWQKLAEIEHQTGQHKYNFVDADLNNGTHYYRLKMVDKSEASNYSNIRSINIESKGDIFVLSPNPFKDKIIINYKIVYSQNLEVNILDILGKLVTKKVIHISKVGNQIELETGHLSKGIYFVKFVLDGRIYSYKMVKE